MTSKFARLSILLVSFALAGCTASTGGATTIPTQPPTATQPVVVDLQPSAVVVATPSPQPTSNASPSPSGGGVAETPAPPSPQDPCTLLTSAEASKAIGVTLGAGKRTIVGPDTVCTWANGATEVKVFLTAPTDPAGAKAYYEAHKGEIPPEAHITELPDFFDGAVIARAALPNLSISAIFVLDGTHFFEMYCAHACSDDDLDGGAYLIDGRLR